jgi:hypothetical protein
MASGDNEAVGRLWDIHQIQQIYLTYATAMDAHHWDLMEACFLEDAEIRLSPLAVKLSGGANVVDFRGWQQMCREIDPTFDSIQHYIYPPLIRLDGDTAYTRVYFVAQHVKNSLRPNRSLTMGGWYNGELVRRGGGWRIAVHELVETWFEGNPEVLTPALEIGAAERTAGHRCPPWLVAMYAK